MATGFANRWQGKQRIGQLWLGRSGMSYDPVVEAGVLAMRPGGLSVLASSSAASVFTLGAIPPGSNPEKILALSTVSSGIFVKAPAGVTFDGTNSVMKSTVAGLISLLAISTTRFMFSPGSTAGLTLSTTT